MKVTKYEFADGARFQAGAVQNADPNEVGQHIDELRQEHKGELTPDDVVKAAKNPNSPLHQFFEWDDSVAAQEHRLKQARGLIRAVVAVYVGDDKPAVRQKAFVHIQEPGANHYREARHAMSLTKTREAVLRRAWEELVQWKKRYKDLEEFASLIDVIEEQGIPEAKEA